jgi:hypothetical protein
LLLVNATDAALEAAALNDTVPCVVAPGATVVALRLTDTDGVLLGDEGELPQLNDITTAAAPTKSVATRV